MAADSLIQAQTEGGLAGQQIDVGLQGDLDMRGNSSISARTTGTGKAAGISVTANSISLTDGASLTAPTDGPGKGGEVMVRANSVTIDGRDSTGATGIVSRSNAGATGSAGDITVNTTGQLVLEDGAVINASTYGLGSAGGVKVTAGSLVMKGNANGPVTFIGSDSGSSGQGGPAGIVAVNINDSAFISGNAEILSGTFGTGSGGKVTVSAGSLTIKSVVGEQVFTGISSASDPNSTGDAGSVAVAVKGQLALQDGGEISSSTFGAGSAGGVKVTAGSLVMIGNDNAPVTIIGSDSESGGQGGQAGTVTVDVGKSASISGNALITSDTFGTGKAGEVTVAANSLSMNGMNTSASCGINSDSLSSGQGGPAGTVTVNVDKSVSISGNALIRSDTYGTGKAGEIIVSAGSLAINFGETGFTGVSSQSAASAKGDAGSIAVAVDGQLALQDGGAISSSTFGVGSAGGVKVTAGSLVMNGNDNATSTFIGSDSLSGGQGGAAGTVTVNINRFVSISGNAQISSSTRGTGKAGEVAVTAKALSINSADTANFCGISSESDATAAGGDAGAVTVNVTGPILMENTAAIDSDTSGQGQAGVVKVSAGSLELRGKEIVGATRPDTGISSDSGLSATGNAGDVTVQVTGGISMFGDAYISSDTFGMGKAGQVIVVAKSLSMNGIYTDASCHISTESDNIGVGGDAGTVTVNIAGPILMESTAAIDSNTSGQGQAGQVRVSAGSLALRGNEIGSGTHISSDSSLFATGNAGDVNAHVTGGISMSGDASISSDTFGVGNAGQVTVAAQSLSMNSMNTSGLSIISSESLGGGPSGAAGTVSIRVADHIDMFKNAEISTDTFGGGKAGNVNVWAGSLSCTGDAGVSSEANLNSTGDAGDVNVIATGQISLSGHVNLGSQTFGSGKGGDVSLIGSKLVQIRGGASITAEASSSAPSDSGQIIVSGGNVQLNGGTINSEANGGSAGQVQVNSSGVLSLYQSQILAGSHQQNGGVIGITAPFLALNQSSVNANAYHTGGTIDIFHSELRRIDAQHRDRDVANGQSGQGRDFQSATDAERESGGLEPARLERRSLSSGPMRQEPGRGREQFHRFGPRRIAAGTRRLGDQLPGGAEG
ncbi:hypothetical protein SBV1_1370001 [Verrucomicrobia bacterium]|nr:hypothetical protein SBV1_1370001 [Verrucomicrobiota bacterium]